MKIAKFLTPQIKKEIGELITELKGKSYYNYLIKGPFSQGVDIHLKNELHFLKNQKAILLEEQSVISTEAIFDEFLINNNDLFNGGGEFEFETKKNIDEKNFDLIKLQEFLKNEQLIESFISRRHVKVIWNLPSFFYVKNSSLKARKIYSNILSTLKENMSEDLNNYDGKDLRVTYICFLDTATDNGFIEKKFQEFYSLFSKTINFNKITDANWKKAVKFGFDKFVHDGNTFSEQAKENLQNEHISNVIQYKNVFSQIQKTGKFLNCKPLNQNNSKSLKIRLLNNNQVERYKDEDKNCYDVSIFGILGKFLYNKSNPFILKIM